MKLEIKDGPLGQKGGKPFPEAEEELKQMSQAKPMPRWVNLLPQKFLAGQFRKVFGCENNDIAGESVESVKSEMKGRGGSVRLWISRPEGENLPVLIYYHGGGWVAGSIDVVENICRGIAAKANCLVINVDYRLAPEHKFPAGVEDCYAALLWAAEHGSDFGGDPGNIFVGGDSAGGNLAAVVSHLAHERKGPAIAGQVLIYPGVDSTEGALKNADLDQIPDFGAISSLYLPKGISLDHPLVSPMKLDSLSHMPPAFVLTAEYCFIRDQGEAYAEKLAEAGVPVKALRYNGLGHAFLDKVGVWPYADECIGDIADYILSLSR